jgi:hypothetical protein
MDVVWVRLAFIFGIWAFGASPLIYVAFWICMPEEEGEKARAPAQSASRPRPVTRFFWFVAAALAFAGAVPCAVFNLRRFPPPQYDLEEFVITASVGVLLFLFSGFALLKARSRARRTFVVGTALPLLLIALLAVSAGSTFWAALDPQRGDEWAIAVSLGVASGVLAFFLGASLLALRRQVISTGREERPRPAYETHAGWLGLGMLLMTLAAAVVAGGTFLAVAGQGVLGNELTRFLPGGPNFARHGQHLLVAIVIFLPGLFCLLMARRSAGPAHIVRGAAGWIAGGVLAGGLSMALVESVAFDSPLEVHFRGFSVPPGAMIMMLLLGVVCGICLAWPARAAARGVSAASPTPERNEAW